MTGPLQRPVSRSGSHRPRAGFTLVEAAVTTSVLLMALLALTSTAVSVGRFQQADRERRQAENALRSICSEVQASSMASVGFPLGWGTGMAASMSPGGALGSTFDVGDLAPVAGAASVGTLRLVVDETLTDPEVGVELGLPRDLDSDGLVDNPDVTATARLLPVVVSLSWAGTAGNRRLLHGFYVSELQ